MIANRITIDEVRAENGCLRLGFLIPLIWKRYRNPLKIFMIGFGFSLSIELCQLFNRRNTDIDDLMMNTLGAVIGYFIWKLTKRLFKNINHKSISLSKLEPIVYLTLAYYVSGNVLEPIGRDYLYSELVNPIFTKDGDNVKVKVGVKFLDNQTKATQISQYELVLHKDSNWKIVG